MLFLPENEIHELGLLYLNYELVLRGNQTIYLGQSLPLDNLSYFFKNDHKIYLITSLTVQPSNEKVEPYFREIEKILSNSEHKLIAIGPKAIQVENLDFNADISFYPSVVELLNQK